MRSGKASGGPRAGVSISAPDNWDGRVKKPDGKTDYPGRYVWKNYTWVWEEARTAVVHRRNGTFGLCGEGKPWATSILLTTNALKVTCPNCRGGMQRYGQSSTGATPSS